jgi:hypothetical protein
MTMAIVVFGIRFGAGRKALLKPFLFRNFIALRGVRRLRLPVCEESLRSNRLGRSWLQLGILQHARLEILEMIVV